MSAAMDEYNNQAPGEEREELIPREAEAPEAPEETKVIDLPEGETPLRADALPGQGLEPSPSRKLNPEKPKKKKKHRALKIILGVILFIAIAAGSGFAAINIKYNLYEREIDETAAMRHGETDRGIATKDLCDFYFNTLTYREQLLYNNILDAAKARAPQSETLRLEYDIDTFSKVAKYVLADNPDLFYVNFDRLVLNHGWHRTYVTMAYSAADSELGAVIAQYESALAEFISATASAKSDFERELALHDYLINHCEYAVEYEDRLHNTSYGALVMKRAYCDGYAYAMKAAFDRLGMQSAIVYGSVNGTDHVWNLILIDGEYYHLDVMWDDADLSFAEGLRFHGYFNLDDARILRDHEYKYKEVLPKAEGKNDYYTALGLHATTAEECTDIILSAMVDAAAEERSYIELLCDTTSENDALAPYFQEAADRANKELDEETFLTAFRVFSASETSNAVTIQIFYISPVDETGTPDGSAETDDGNEGEDEGENEGGADEGFDGENAGDGEKEGN